MTVKKEVENEEIFFSQPTFDSVVSGTGVWVLVKVYRKIIYYNLPKQGLQSIFHFHWKLFS